MRPVLRAQCTPSVTTMTMTINIRRGEFMLEIQQMRGVIFTLLHDSVFFTSFTVHAVVVKGKMKGHKQHMFTDNSSLNTVLLLTHLCVTFALTHSVKSKNVQLLSKVRL